MRRTLPRASPPGLVLTLYFHWLLSILLPCSMDTKKELESAVKEQEDEARQKEQQ